MKSSFPKTMILAKIEGLPHVERVDHSVGESSYWTVDFRRGWSTDNGEHVVLSKTLSGLYALCRKVEPCDCEQCS